MQNDVISEGGAFAASGAPAHARAQNVVENMRRLAAAARARGVADDPRLVRRRAGRAGPDAQRAAVRGHRRQQGDGARRLGRGAGRGLEPQPGDFVVEKMRMSAWEGTRLETILKSARAAT